MGLRNGVCSFVVCERERERDRQRQADRQIYTRMKTLYQRLDLNPGH